MTDKPSGQPVGGAWAQQQKEGLKKQEQAKKESTAPSADPNKSRGELTEGRPEPDADQREGGAGKPQASSLEPEKQGGIGGP